ncbi:MAG TPA: DUF5655 domain-containing protein [Vicinamibacterales bacterium]|nr:DUF5655 domain-containing protein [Vicinamibacterales bacterium]
MDKALQTQLANIETRTGKSLDELTRYVKASGLTRHGEIRTMLMETLGMGHGDANTLVHYALKSAAMFAQTAASGDVDAELDRIYTGPRAALRPIHDRVMAAVTKFGPFEIAPKKTYLSLRRKKQFAMVGPATNTRVEVGLNMKGVKGTGRLEALPPGGMCQYKVRLSSPAEVDAELLAWIRRAYDASA